MVLHAWNTRRPQDLGRVEMFTGQTSGCGYLNSFPWCAVSNKFTPLKALFGIRMSNAPFKLRKTSSKEQLRVSTRVMNDGQGKTKEP